jgi:hypothetical protein
MANKRNLKKDIQSIFSELLAECYTLSYIFPQIDKTKVDAIAINIIEKSDDFVKRAGKPDGKENPSIVKTYYKKLYKDVAETVAVIIQDIHALKSN